MSRRFFYHQIIEIDSLFVELEDLDLSLDEKKHLAELLDANLHHSLLEVILSELNEEDKNLFLHHLAKDNDSEIWELLNKRVENVETKIRTIVEEIKGELHEDIRSAKKLKKGDS